MEEKIKQIQSKVTEQLGRSNVLAASSYIPLVGWIYPYFMRREDELCQWHARQAMQLNLVTFVLYFGIWCLENFIIVSMLFGVDGVLHPISRTVWLLCIFSYMIISSVGAYQAFCGNSWGIPYLKKAIDTVVYYVKKSFQAN